MEVFGSTMNQDCKTWWEPKNAEDQLMTMKLADNDNPKTHLSELKQHFQTMLYHCDNLMKIGLTMSDNCFNIIIMSSLPESYQSMLQTITTSEQLSRLSGNQSNAMGANNLITFITEKTQHWVLNDECIKTAESALSAQLKKSSKGKGKRQDKFKSNETCKNCNKPGHTKPKCYFKGGGKEGHGLWQKGKAKKAEPVVVAVADDRSDLCAFTCSLDAGAKEKSTDAVFFAGNNQEKLGKRSCYDFKLYQAIACTRIWYWANCNSQQLWVQVLV